MIWSRKEGVNRAIIEGMFAGTPCIVREGFNYGYHYPYINSQTGLFSTERELPAKLVWMTENHDRFAPRDWVMAHMTCQHATSILNDAVRQASFDCGERWTEDLAVKTSGLNGLKYWLAEDQKRFEPDYAFLRSTIQR